MDAFLENADESKMNLSDGQYLEFTLNNISCGTPISFVTEIIEMQKITPIPNSPLYIKGVINLRGKLIPTMDLRLRFGMPEKEYGEKTCIIIVDVNNHTNRQIGLVVDMVSEVIDIPESEIEHSFGFNFLENENFLEGIGKIKDKAVMLLNISSVINTGEITNYVDNNTKVVAMS